VSHFIFETCLPPSSQKTGSVSQRRWQALYPPEFKLSPEVDAVVDAVLQCTGESQPLPLDDKVAGQADQADGATSPDVTLPPHTLRHLVHGSWRGSAGQGAAGGGARPQKQRPVALEKSAANAGTGMEELHWRHSSLVILLALTPSVPPERLEGVAQGLAAAAGMGAGGAATVGGEFPGTGAAAGRSADSWSGWCPPLVARPLAGAAGLRVAVCMAAVPAVSGLLAGLPEVTYVDMVPAHELLDLQVCEGALRAGLSLGGGRQPCCWAQELLGFKKWLSCHLSSTTR
jgi:hypothetical protein